VLLLKIGQAVQLVERFGKLLLLAQPGHTWL